MRRESDSRRPALVAGLVACAWASVLATGCGSRVVDRTAAVAPYVPPINRQLFAADVTPESSSRVIRDVKLELEGTTTSMTNTSGARWERSALVPPCREIIPYRFVVSTGPAQSPDEPAQIEVFPEVGSFTRLITDQPAACGKAPNDGNLGFRVNTTEDLVDAVPGDGFCSTTRDPSAKGSRCSLRAAVMEANHRPGLDVIILGAQRYRLSLTGKESDDTPNEAVGDLDITDSVSIESSFARSNCTTSIATFLNPDDNFSDRGGTGSNIAHIDGGGIDRVFDVYSAPEPNRTQVYLSCLHVFGGRVEADIVGPRRFGGGVMNRGVLVMDHVALRANTMTGATGGAGLSNSGEVLVRDSALLSNLGSTDGAVFGGTDGGAIYNGGDASITVERSVLALNSAARGAAIENDSHGRLTLVNSTVTDNIGNWGDAEALSSAVFSRGTVDIAWSTLRAGQHTLFAIGETNVVDTLLTSDFTGGSVCTRGLSDTATVIGVRTIDESCIPSRWRGRLNNVVQPIFLRGLRSSLEMLGGFTPVLSIRRPNPDEDPSEFPMDTALTLTGCPATDQRGRPRPTIPTTCDPGAMELQPEDR